jgi:hypothetical protein
MAIRNDFLCPKCNTRCDRDEVDVGVGVIFGPYGCPNCDWSEDPRYDLSNGQDSQRDGGTVDCRGGWTRNRLTPE